MDEDSKGTLCISGPAADGKQLEVSPQDQTDPKSESDIDIVALISVLSYVLFATL